MSDDKTIVSSKHQGFLDLMTVLRNVFTFFLTVGVMTLIGVMMNLNSDVALIGEQIRTIKDVMVTDIRQNATAAKKERAGNTRMISDLKALLLVMEERIKTSR